MFTWNSNGLRAQVHQVTWVYGTAVAPVGSCTIRVTFQNNAILAPIICQICMCSTVSQSIRKFATSPTDPRSWGGLETYAAQVGGNLHKLRSHLPRSGKACGL